MKPKFKTKTLCLRLVYIYIYIYIYSIVYFICIFQVLRKQRELCDVVLIVGNQRIFAHRVILSACSPYFHAMFTSELAESRQTEVG